MKRFPSPCRPAILLLTASCAFASAAHPQCSPATPPATDPVLIDAQGFKKLLEQHRGKPVMVNFWATWCEPCRDEYPVVNDLARLLAPHGLIVLGISFDDDPEINLVRSFLRKFKPIFPNYRRRPGTEPEVVRAADPAWRGTLPATFFYDRDGKLAARLIGAQKRPALESAARALLETTRPKD